MILNSNKKNKKAYFQLDLIFAGLLFFIVLLTIIQIQNDYFFQTNTKQNNLQLKATAKDLCKTLSQTQGIPQNWHADITTIKSLGLQNQTTQLSTEKLNQLENINYQKIKKNLNLNKYNFKITIKNIETNSIIKSFGHLPKSSKTNIASYQCYISSENLNKILVEVWK